MTDTVSLDGAVRPAIHIIALTAILDDDRWFDVRADQRDQRLALQLIPDPEADKIGFGWACAWACLHRTGALDGMGWAVFQKHVIEVNPTEGVAVVAPVDPTPPASAG